MIDDRRDRRRPFRHLRPPAAPSGLRERTLAGARAAAEAAGPLRLAGEERPGRPGWRSLTDLLWESRPLRLAWAVALVCLIGVNLYLDRAPARAPDVRAAATSQRPAEVGPRTGLRTLLASREGVFEALLGQPARRADPSTATRPRSTS
jgi:hypothetical protein